VKTLIATVLLAVLFALFFLARPRHITTAPQPVAGVIYDVETATGTAAPAPPPPLAGRQDLPRFTVYAMANVPEEFVVRAIPSRSQADFILMTESLIAQKTVVPAKQPEQQQAAAHTTAKPAAKATTTMGRKTNATNKEPQEQPVEDRDTQTEEVTPQILQRVVAGSGNNYYYPDKNVGTDVVLALVSRTPYGGKQILRFRVENKLKRYFFIAAVSLEDADGTAVEVQPYHEQYVSPGTVMEGYLITGRIRNAVLKLTESGGVGRCLELKFAM
jgi:hypothetical protein